MATIWQSIINFGQDLAALIAKAIPSDEQRLAAFKLRSPKLYARAQEHMINGIVYQCREKKLKSPADDAAIDALVGIVCADLPTSEEALVSTLVKTTIHNKPFFI